jgi:hypothetical protein
MLAKLQVLAVLPWTPATSAGVTALCFVRCRCTQHKTVMPALVAVIQGAT